MNAGKSRGTLAIANSDSPSLTYRLAPQHNYFSSHRSVNTTGTQLFPLPSLRKRPSAGDGVCGPAINTSSRASLGSNGSRVAAAAFWSMSKTAVTSGCCNWTRCAWMVSFQNRIFCSLVAFDIRDVNIGIWKDAPLQRYKPEQIVTLLRQIEVEIANRKTTPQVCKEAQITVQTYYRFVSAMTHDGRTVLSS